MKRKLLKIYLAIPYSGMEESSFEQATKLTAKLIQEGFNVFSPITHSHPLVPYGIPGDWKFWEKIDEQFIEWADVVVVCVPKEGFDKVEYSTGVQSEIEIASNIDKPVFFYHQDIYDVSDVLDGIEELINEMDATLTDGVYS